MIASEIFTYRVFQAFQGVYTIVGSALDKFSCRIEAQMRFAHIGAMVKSSNCWGKLGKTTHGTGVVQVVVCCRHVAPEHPIQIPR